MKNLSKTIAVAFSLAALFFASNVKAQTKADTSSSHDWHLGIGLETGIPTGRANNTSNIELGGTARLQYGVSRDFAITLTSGYYDLIGKEIPGTTNHYAGYQIIPVKLGIKEFFAPKIYFGAEAGAGFVTNSDGHTKLLLAPALGYASKSWDVGVRYENISGQGFNYGLAGLRIAYAFPL